MKRKIKRRKIQDIMEDPRYRGKHVVVVAGRVFTAKTGDKASKILEMVRKKYPQEIPAVTYIPKADSLILILWF